MQFFLSKGFEKQFRKIPKKVKEKAVAQFEIFIADPMDKRLSNHGLTGAWVGHRSINITGDIRAVYRLKTALSLGLLRLVRIANCMNKAITDGSSNSIHEFAQAKTP